MCVWWPSISLDIEHKVQGCNFCQTHRPTQQKEPLITTELPSGPWVKIAADLCEINNKQYLVVMDFYSKYIELAYLPKTTSSVIIDKFKNMFCRWGDPEELCTDGASYFTSHEFQNFAKQCDFKHTISSAHYSQGNGEAEAAVKIAKSILRQKDIFSALRAYLSTPVKATGFSPSQLMIARNIRTNLPSMQGPLRPKWPKREMVKKRDKVAKQNYKQCFDRKNTVRPLTPFHGGEKVRMKTDKEKTWEKQGLIKEASPDTRSYIVETPNGSYKRNRRHLKPVTTPSIPLKTDTNVPEDTGTLGQSEQPSSPQKEPTIQEPPETPKVEPDSLKTRSGRVIRRPMKFDDFV